MDHPKDQPLCLALDLQGKLKILRLKLRISKSPRVRFQIYKTILVLAGAVQAVQNRIDKLESCCEIFLFMTSLTETDGLCGKDAKRTILNKKTRPVKNRTDN